MVFITPFFMLYKLYIYNMLRILTFKLFEKNHYEETSWSKKIGGVDVKITIQDIQKLLDDGKVPIEEVSVSEIADMCVHKDKTDEETLKRSESSDLKFPIIISKNMKGEMNMILDGHHRLLKAINSDKDTIKARILDLSECGVEYQEMFA